MASSSWQMTQRLSSDKAAPVITRPSAQHLNGQHKQLEQLARRYFRALPIAQTVIMPGEVADGRHAGRMQAVCS